MPIYEYSCRACGHDFETLVRASETPKCAKCESADLEKKLSVFSSQAPSPEPAPCGACGHPGGPGSCALN